MTKLEKHSRGCHVTVKGCQVKDFCEIVQLPKNFEYPRCFIYINHWNDVVFFHQIFDKSQVKARKNENTEKDEVAFSTGCLLKSKSLRDLSLPLPCC